MNNELQIVTGEDLLASIDDGTNRLFINSTEIDSSNWVGSGTYTTTISGHNISIVKIDSLDGNIGLKRLSEYNYELFRYETGSITADDVIGLKSFIEADDINVADNYATFTESSSRTNIASGDNLKTIFGKIKKFFSDLKTVAFTGAYSDLTGTPTIPTVNNGTLTVTQNGTSVGTFTANQSGNTTIATTDTNTWRGIQNNLTSTSTTDSLSANQGRILYNYEKDIVVCRSFTSAVTQLSANNTGTITITMSVPSGYKYLSVVNLASTWSSGVSGYSWCVVYDWSVSGNKITAICRNYLTSGAIKTAIRATVLFIRNL